jgi:hypothetical protein
VGVKLVAGWGGRRGGRRICECLAIKREISGGLTEIAGEYEKVLLARCYNYGMHVASAIHR